MESLTRGNGSPGLQLDNVIEVPIRRKSLSPPSLHSVIWEDYIGSLPGKPPCIGRDLICKENTKVFKATLAMVS